VTIAILVLVIALGMGLTAASGHFSQAATRHEQEQAHYTALSSTDTLSAWIIKDGADAQRLLSTVPSPADTPDSIVINTDGLPAEVGTCAVNLRFLDSEKTVLKITSTASYAGARETVSLTLARPLISEDEKGDGGGGNTGGWPSFESKRDKKVIAKGETMTIPKSSVYETLPDFYVDGGTLIIETGAMIKTNIYAYNGGVVDIRGSYAQTFPSETNDRVNDGIFIFGESAFGVKINKTTISSAGKLMLPYLSSGVNNGLDRDKTPGVHLVGGVWLELVGGTSSDKATSGYFLLCTGTSTDKFGQCPHVHGDGSESPSPDPDPGDASGHGDWTIGSYTNE
jgi:hypothetical protein